MLRSTQARQKFPIPFADDDEHIVNELNMNGPAPQQLVTFM
jgi:hypothetical protein